MRQVDSANETVTKRRCRPGRGPGDDLAIPRGLTALAAAVALMSFGPI